MANEDYEDLVTSDTTEDQTASAANDVFDMFEPPPEVDPNKFGPVPVVSAGTVTVDELLGTPPTVDLTADVGLPHWTEPATGQVPRVVAPDNDRWSELAGPRWKGEGPDWADDDIAGVFGTGADAIDTYSIGTDSIGTDSIGTDSIGTDMSDEPVIIDDEEDELNGLIAPGAGAPQRPAVRPRPKVEATQAGERNIPQAIMMGIVLAAVALLGFRLGNLYALGLITVAAALGSIELFDTMRRAGVHPATLLGVVASVCFPLAVYSRGDQAFPLVIALLVVFGALWYLSGADTHRPALNLGLTFLGVAWIGGMAAFGSLLLNLPDGRSTIVTAIVITVASDTAALAGGKTFGRHPFHSASPSKTWEGTVIGFVAAIAAGVVMGVYGISPFSNDLMHAALLGVVGGVLAPLGDLTESMVKRDLGVKDMGRLLPGHGGVLDRVDGLLFVLPGVYYLTLVLGLDEAVAAVIGQ